MRLQQLTESATQPAHALYRFSCYCSFAYSAFACWERIVQQFVQQSALHK
jgi:hypothetical protein